MAGNEAWKLNFVCEIRIVWQCLQQFVHTHNFESQEHLSKINRIKVKRIDKDKAREFVPNWRTLFAKTNIVNESNQFACFFCLSVICPFHSCTDTWILHDDRIETIEFIASPYQSSDPMCKVWMWSKRYHYSPEVKWQRKLIPQRFMQSDRLSSPTHWNSAPQVRQSRFSSHSLGIMWQERRRPSPSHQGGKIWSTVLDGVRDQWLSIPWPQSRGLSVKDWVGECLCSGNDWASGPAEQSGSGVWWAIKPAEYQVVCSRGICWALELAARSKLGSPPVLHQLGKRASKGCQARQAM